MRKSLWSHRILCPTPPVPVFNRFPVGQIFSKEVAIYRGTAGIVSYLYVRRGWFLACLPRRNKLRHTHKFFPLGHFGTEGHTSATYSQASSASLILLNSCCNSLKICCGHPISLDYCEYRMSDVLSCFSVRAGADMFGHLSGNLGCEDLANDRSYIAADCFRWASLKCFYSQASKQDNSSFLSLIDTVQLLYPSTPAFPV